MTRLPSSFHDHYLLPKVFVSFPAFPQLTDAPSVWHLVSLNMLKLQPEAIWCVTSLLIYNLILILPFISHRANYFLHCQHSQWASYCSLLILKKKKQRHQNVQSTTIIQTYICSQVKKKNRHFWLFNDVVPLVSFDL